MNKPASITADDFRKLKFLQHYPPQSPWLQLVKLAITYAHRQAVQQVSSNAQKRLKGAQHA
jgi:hypothetical protein